MPENRSAYEVACELAAALATSRPDLLAGFLPILEKLKPCRHGPDFASVRWQGKPYQFSTLQSAAVRILWEAWENGTPDVRQETILTEIGSDANKLSDVFRDNPAWGSMIVPGGFRGTFRLAEAPPDDNATERE
jgi:hypothetical protein